MNRVLKSRLRSQVVVTRKDGAAFGGVLWEADRNALVLRNTAVLGAGDNKTDLPLAGELIILMPDIAHIQRA